ncbi:hypothetical protein ACFQH8_00335 [Halomicroarcula sp. GCM10025710]
MGRFVLVVAFTVLLAGCGGAVSSDESPVVTPAPVPTDGQGYPPGVTSDGVIASEVASAHVRSLEARSHTLTTGQEVRARNGALLQLTNETRTVAADAEVYQGQRYQESNTFRSGQERATVSFWSNGTHVTTRYWNQERDGKQRVRQEVSERRVPVTDLTDRRHLQGFLAGVNVAPTRRTDDGGVLLAGRGFSDQGYLVVPLVLGNPSDIRLQMRVRHDGVIVAARIQYSVLQNGRPVSVERVTRVTDIGTTSVERPAWVNGTAGLEDSLGQDGPTHAGDA